MRHQGRNGEEIATDGEGGASASSGPARVAAARVGWNAIRARTIQAALAVNLPEAGALGRSLQVGVDLAR